MPETAQTRVIPASTESAQTTKQGAEADALLKQSQQLSDWSATVLTDVVDLCEEPDGERLPLHDAHALLGRAYIAKRSAQWALEEADKTIEQLVFQVQVAEDHFGSA